MTDLTNRAEHDSPATRFLFDIFCRRGTVMVNNDCDGRRHLRLYQDDQARFYVRTNKRGQTKRILTSAKLIAGIVWEFGYEKAPWK